MCELDFFDDDYEMTPEERENAVRSRFTEVQNEILQTVAHLCNLYREYDYLQETVAEIDIYGADDYYCPRPAKTKLIARTGNGDYVF